MKAPRFEGASAGPVDAILCVADIEDGGAEGAACPWVDDTELSASCVRWDGGGDDHNSHGEIPPRFECQHSAEPCAYYQSLAHSCNGYFHNAY